MEENKTTRVNRTVNYYSDRPDYDRHMEKHNCHCERPHYDHCPEKPEYEHHPIRPNHDHYPVKPDYDHHPVRPNYDHYPVKPEYDHHPVRPNYDHYPVKPDYDHHPVRPNHDCYDEKHDNDYRPQRPECDPRQEKTKPNCFCCPETKLRPNECGKCCKPVEVHCPDISCAECTPILADRVFDFKCFNRKFSRVYEGALFNLDPRPDTCPPYVTGAPICVEKISLVYDCIGIADDMIPINICQFDATLMNTGVLCTSTTPALTLYSNYEVPLNPSSLCCNKGSSASIAQFDITPGIINAQYIIEGFIGCEPFVARFPAAPGTVSPIDPAYTDLSIFGNICVPTNGDSLTLRAQFDLKLLVKSIAPTTPFTANGDGTGGSFTARIFDELSINEQLFVTKSDTLVVYSSPAEFKHHEE